MTPMIDVTFQLIAFFMFVLNFTEVDQDQRINLPLSELARPPDVAYDEPITIQLTADETILFAGDHLTPGGLKSALLREAQIIKAHPEKKVSDVTVIIRAESGTKARRLPLTFRRCAQGAVAPRFTG